MRVATRPRGDPLPLIDRDEELGRLDAVLDAARSGTGATLLIEGPSGIGKTSLLRACRDRAASRGMTVLHARGTSLERTYPMGVARQCLEPAVRRAPDASALLSGAARLAEPVVLEVPKEISAAPVDTLHGLYWLTANLARSAPLLLAVDDVQWADEPSLRFLAYLARRVDSVPVAVVLCVRDEEEAVSSDLIADIRGDGATVIVQPAPLPVTGVEKLLEALEAGPVDRGFATACHDATGGNPFLLGELARSLHAEGVPFTAAGIELVDEVTPPTVARKVRAAIDRLGPVARAVAQATAVLGDDTELELAAALADVPIHEASRAAGELARAGILEDASTLRFRHSILAAGVRANHFATERAAAHARAAQLLRARGAGPERVSLQLMHATPAGDEGVVAVLRSAAERATARGAPSTAIALLRRALSEPPATAQRGPVLLELGRLEYAVGQSVEAAVHLDEAQRCAVDPVTRGRALFALFQTSPGGLASRRALSPLVEQTLGELEDRDRELALRLRAIRTLLMTASATDASTILAEGRGLTGATPGEAVLLGHLWFVRMGADATAAEVAGFAERAARQAEALLEEGSMALVITGIVLGLCWTDRLDQAERVLNLAIAVARRRGSTADFAIAHTHRAWVHRRAGRLLEAEADARSALAMTGEYAWSWAGRPSVTPLLASLLDQGRVDEAAQELAAAHEEGQEILDAPPMTPLLLERMRLRAAQRDYRGALADWDEAVRRAERLRGVNPPWIGDVAVAAEVQHALGDLAAARSLTGQAFGLARRWGTPGAMGQALHARARLGDCDDVAETSREAVEHLRRSPARLELARALVTHGGALRRRGNRVESRGPLREGYDLALQCGAAGLAGTARAELRASGLRVRRETLTGAASLTASERRIADLAAGGDTNAEIAQALFLTVKTVEMHLTSAYRKLGVRSRRDLPAALSATA